MGLLDLLLLLLIAALAGGAGAALGGLQRGGCLVAIALGFLGAMVGRWIAGELGLPPILTIEIDGRPFPLIWAILGAAILSALFGLLSSNRRART